MPERLFEGHHMRPVTVSCSASTQNARRLHEQLCNGILAHHHTLEVQTAKVSSDSKSTQETLHVTFVLCFFLHPPSVLKQLKLQPEGETTKSSTKKKNNNPPIAECHLPFSYHSQTFVVNFFILFEDPFFPTHNWLGNLDNTSGDMKQFLLSEAFRHLCRCH